MGIRITQRREFKGEDVVPVGESQGIDVWDGLLEYRLSADGHRFVEDFEASDHDRRHVGIVPDIFREERGNAIAAAKEHLSIPALLITTPRELIALQAVGDVVVSKCLRLRIEPGYPLLGADPKPACAIFENAHDVDAGQALDFRVAGEGFVLPVIPVEALSGGQPQGSGPVFVNGADAAALKPVGVTQVGRVVHKCIRLLVEAAQYATPRPQPERAGTIAMKRRDGICQAGRSTWSRPVIGKPVRCRIKAANPAKLSHP